MKTLFLVLAVAGLSGCAVYPAPAYEAYGGAGPPYVVGQPVYIQGDASYGNYGNYGYSGYPQPYAYPRRYYRVHPGDFPRYQPFPYAYPLRPGHGARHRDGDGVRNRQERRPNDLGRP